MRNFRDLGIPAEEIWEIATRKAGETLGVPLLGTIQVGAPADLLIFRRDPTTDLAHFDSLEAVISKGRLFTRGELDAAVESYQEHYAQPVIERMAIEVARLIMDSTVLRDY